ncbi:MAG: alginate lyase family protein [Candidatus Latescibacteria bacterium]|nr:alginate lyase family protein [Candidatus Latescibacterota bacterium]
MTGPRMTDADLFEALNLDCPGMGKVKEAIGQNNMPTAKQALATYYRLRETPVWPGDDRSDGSARYNMPPIEEAMSRTVTVMDATHSFGAGNPINWFHNPTGGDSGLAFNPEWTWQLSRHGAWRILGSTYLESKNEIYAQEFASQLVSWLRECVRPLEGNVNAAGSAWRTIESGIRMGGSWPTSFFAFRQSPSVDDEALLGMVKGFVEHAYHLIPESRFKAGSNWGTMESNGLFCVGVLFPEFKEAEKWRTTAINRLYGELDKQVYPDGMQIELTSSYHGVSLRNFLGPLLLARLNNVPVPEDYLTKLEKMYDYNLFAAMPNGDLPPVNDSGRSNTRNILRKAAELFPKRSDFLWMASEGQEGTRPSKTSYAFPYSGYLIMRSGWDMDDLYMMVDVGPFGYGHQHEDKLNLITYAFGRHHIIDPGSYRYERSKWRSHIKTSFAHNTVIVDGEGQRRAGAEDRWDYVVKEPLPHTWISEANYDYAAGIYDEGYGDAKDRTVTHRRRVLFIKPTDGIAGYWIVSDLLTSSDNQPHHYETLFHVDVSPDSIMMIPDSLHTVTKNAESSNFAICPVPVDGLSGAVLSGQEEPVLRGWQRGPDAPLPLPVASYTFEATGTVRALYVLYPISEGTELPIRTVESIPLDGDGIGARIEFVDGMSHSIIQADQSGASLCAGDIETDGEVAWVAVDKSETVKQMILVRGTVLKRNGIQIS